MTLPFSILSSRHHTPPITILPSHIFFSPALQPSFCRAHLLNFIILIALLFVFILHSRSRPVPITVPMVPVPVPVPHIAPTVTTIPTPTPTPTLIPTTAPVAVSVSVSGTNTNSMPRKTIYVNSSTLTGDLHSMFYSLFLFVLILSG